MSIIQPTRRHVRASGGSVNASSANGASDREQTPAAWWEDGHHRRASLKQRVAQQVARRDDRDATTWHCPRSALLE